MENRGVLRSPPASPGPIPAVSVSTLVAPLFDTSAGSRRGLVLSVHRSALNLEIDGLFVTVAEARSGGLPNGVLVADPFDPRSLGIRAGGHLGVTVRSVRRWSPGLKPIGRPVDLRVRAGIARRAAAGHAGGLDGLVRAADALDALAEAFASGSEAEVVRAGRGLVGLGAGLTPAGDDVLVGVTAGLAALGDPRARRAAADWAQHAIGRTTVVAESFHRYAAVGAYSERLHDILRAILGGPVAGIPGAVAAAAAWGATSGADTLAGILLALDPPIANTRLGAA